MDACVNYQVALEGITDTIKSHEKMLMKVFCVLCVALEEASCY
jgi:hypothetical protein